METGDNASGEAKRVRLPTVVATVHKSKRNDEENNDQGNVPKEQQQKKEFKLLRSLHNNRQQPPPYQQQPFQNSETPERSQQRPPPPYRPDTFVPNQHPTNRRVDNDNAHTIIMMSAAIADTADAPAFRERGYDYTDYQEELMYKRLRKAFVFKVYMILFGMLLYTLIWVLLSCFVPVFQLFWQQYWFAVIPFAVLFFILYYLLMCSQKIRRTHPINLIVLLASVVCVTACVSCVAAVASQITVLLAVGVTILIVLAVTFYAKLTPWDITGYGIWICMIIFVVVIMASVLLVIGFIFKISLMWPAICFALVLVMTCILIYDTQQIVGGRRVEVSPEEYILGALTLYIDIILVFIFLVEAINYSGA